MSLLLARQGTTTTASVTQSITKANPERPSASWLSSGVIAGIVVAALGVVETISLPAQASIQPGVVPAAIVVGALPPAIGELPPGAQIQPGVVPGAIAVANLPPLVGVLPAPLWLQAGVLSPPILVSSVQPIGEIPPPTWLQPGVQEPPEESGVLVVGILAPTVDLPPEPSTQPGVVSAAIEVATLPPLVGEVPPPSWLQPGVLTAPIEVAILPPLVDELPPEPSIEPGVLSPIETVTTLPPLIGELPPPSWLQSGVVTPQILVSSLQPIGEVPPPTWLQPGVEEPPEEAGILVVSLLPSAVELPPEPSVLPGVVPGSITTSTVPLLVGELPPPTWLQPGVEAPPEESGVLVVALLPSAVDLPPEPSVLPGVVPGAINVATLPPLIGELPTPSWLQPGVTFLPLVSSAAGPLENPQGSWLQAGVPLEEGEAGQLVVALLPPVAERPPNPSLQTGATAGIVATLTVPLLVGEVPPPTWLQPGVSSLPLVSSVAAALENPPPAWLQSGVPIEEGEAGSIVVALLAPAAELPPPTWLQAGGVPAEGEAGAIVVSILPAGVDRPLAPTTTPGVSQAGEITVPLLSIKLELLPPDPNLVPGVIPPVILVAILPPSRAELPPITWLQAGAPGVPVPPRGSIPGSGGGYDGGYDDPNWQNDTDFNAARRVRHLEHDELPEYEEFDEHADRGGDDWGIPDWQAGKSVGSYEGNSPADRRPNTLILTEKVYVPITDYRTTVLTRTKPHIPAIVAGVVGGIAIGMLWKTPAFFWAVGGAALGAAGYFAWRYWFAKPAEPERLALPTSPGIEPLYSPPVPLFPSSSFPKDVMIAGVDYSKQKSDAIEDAKRCPVCGNKPWLERMNPVRDAAKNWHHPTCPIVRNPTSRRR